MLAAFVVASRVSRPLRRMARIAADVDAGELTHRIGQSGPHDEVRALAEAFDRMLDRLQDAFARQRSFASDASHELRTPLTIVRGQLEVLAGQPDVTREDVRRVERVVSAEVQRMQRLIDDLLLLARTDEGPLHDVRRIDVHQFLTEVFDRLSATGDRRFALDDVPVGTVPGDADRLEQVIGNLVRNAVQHTEPGGLVRLSGAVAGDRLLIRVDDDGPGIPEHQADRVFDRFYRTDSARTRAAGGTGLGLSISRAIAEAHGGRVFAERSPEGGARVGFELPGFAPAKPTAPRSDAGVDDRAAARQASSSS
jgi:signal transduction histidine kinase